MKVREVYLIFHVLHSRFQRGHNTGLKILQHNFSPVSPNYSYLRSSPNMAGKIKLNISAYSRKQIHVQGQQWKR